MGNDNLLHVIRLLLLMFPVFSAAIANAEHQFDVKYNEGAIEGDTKIVGGVEATANEFPWLVNLRKNGQVFCCGAIIKPTLVLTAAHCVLDLKSSDEVYVLAGDHRLSVTEQSEQMRRATQIVYHKNYSSDVTGRVNDVAAIIVESKFFFSVSVKPIALPTTQIEFGSVMVAGWGSLHETPTEITNVLMKAELDLVALNRCRDSYASSKVSIADSMLCASRLGKDFCQGDRGGPLICGSSGSNNNQTYICGIVSFGIGCARFEFPGVYTKVSSFVTWIESIKVPNSAPTLQFTNVLIFASFVSTHNFIF